MTIIAFQIESAEVVIMDYSDVDYDNPTLYIIEPKPYRELGLKMYGPEGIELDENGDEINQNSETEMLRKQVKYLEYQINQLRNYNCSFNYSSGYFD